MKKKWLVVSACIFIFFAAAYFSFDPIIHKIGKNELHALAVETHYCRTDDCSEGIEAVTKMLAQKSGLSTDQIPWCIATNKIYNDDYSSLNGLKTKFVDWMYQRCERGELTLDDANIVLEPLHSPRQSNDDDE